MKSWSLKGGFCIFVGEKACCPNKKPLAGLALPSTAKEI
jgi:hypothetical protein